MIREEKTQFFKAVRKTLTGDENGLDIHKAISLLPVWEVYRRMSNHPESFFICKKCGAIFPTDINLDANTNKCTECDFIETSPFRNDSTEDDKLAYLLVICKGLRTFDDVIKKTKFAFDFYNFLNIIYQSIEGVSDEN